MFFSKVDKTIEINATVFPVCLCGEPWQSHGSCGGYKPSRPIENYETVAFQSPHILATILWKLESLIKKLRRKLI